MSGIAWRDRARRVVDAGAWPDDVTSEDREAVEDLARGPGLEPYWSLKALIEAVEGGYYRPPERRTCPAEHRAAARKMKW